MLLGDFDVGLPLQLRLHFDRRLELRRQLGRLAVFAIERSFGADPPESPPGDTDVPIRAEERTCLRYHERSAFHHEPNLHSKMSQ